MISSLSDSKKCRQISLFEVHLLVNGTAGTPAVTGIDATAALSVTDLGTGNYKINLKDKAQRALILESLVLFTASRVYEVTASDVSSVTLQFRNLSGTAADADFGCVLGWHGNSNLF